MVAFKLPEHKTISLSEDYLVPLGLGWCTLKDGFLYADSELDDQQIAAIEAEGFVRADTEWYEISPEPPKPRRMDLLVAFGTLPVTTKVQKTLKISFIKALSPESLKAVSNLGYQINKIAPS